MLYNFLGEVVTEILVNENVAMNLDPDPEPLSIHPWFSNIKCSVPHGLSFKPPFSKIDQESPVIQVFEEMLT